MHVSGCRTDLNHSEFIFLYLSEASYDDVFSLMDLCLGQHCFLSLDRLQRGNFSEVSQRSRHCECCRTLHAHTGKAPQFVFYILTISWLHRENSSWIAAAVVAPTIAMLVVRFHGHIVARVGKACAI